MMSKSWMYRSILLAVFAFGLASNGMAGIAGLVRQSTYDKLYCEHMQLYDMYQQMKSENDRLNGKIGDLNGDVTARDLDIVNLTRVKEDLEKLRKYQIVVWMEGALLVGLTLVILLGKRKQQPSKPAQDEDRCPRCGFKKTKGDSHCRNCNLRF